MIRFTLILLLLSFSFLSIETIAHPGIGVVMDSAGNVYYTDLTHVWKISPNGTRSIAVQNVHTHELYLAPNGDLFGEHEWYEGEESDKWGNYVWCLRKDGSLEQVTPRIEGFLDNTTLVRDLNGNSYWSRKADKGEELMKQTLDGCSHTFTTHKFNNIRWLHYSANDNHLYVVDHLTIKKVSPSGNVEVLVKTMKEDTPPFEGVADHHYIFGLWTDDHHNVYVAQYGAQMVRKIDPEGIIATVFTSQEGWSPCGGMMDKEGVLWIMEFSDKHSTRVRKVTAHGKDEVYGG